LGAVLSDCNMVRVRVRKHAKVDGVAAITAAFAYRDAHGEGDAGWKKGWAVHVEKETLAKRGVLTTWLQPKPGVWFPTLDKALAAHARRRHGGDKQVNITVDAQLKQQLHDHVISLWRGLWVPPASYVRAKWLRLQAAAKIVAKPFSDEQYASFKTEWRLSERIPDGAKARRLEAEKPESILNYFNGCNETIGDETVHHFGLMEVLSWPCDTRNGKTRSFADCLASGEERMGGADESCLMKAAKEARGVGPAEALAFCRVTDGDRDSITVLVTTGVFGTLYRRFYIKKGSVWTENYMKGKLARRNCRLLLKPDSYMMDGDILVMVLEQMAKEMNVTPEYRYLLLLDGHSSCLEPAVRAAAKRLGFVIHLGV